MSRTRLLDAGLEVFAELALTDLFSEIGPRRVVRRLGDVSSGAFYHHFPDRAAYLEALVDHGVGAESDVVVEDAVARLLDVADSPDPEVLELVAEVSRRDFERRSSGGLDAQRFRLCVWLGHGEESARTALHRRYEGVAAQYLAVYDRVLERWGREWRPPFTARSAAAVFAALLEGLVIRHCVDPETAPVELYGTAVKALLPILTRPVGDSDTLDDATAALGGRFGAPPTPRIDDPDARRRMLDAALAHADAGAYQAASVEEMAADADVPAEAAYAQFSGKPGLAAATFARFVPMLERPLRTDLDEQRDPVDAIRRHLGRLAEVATRHRGLTNALLEAVQHASIRYGSHIGPNDPRAIVPLPQLLVPAVEAGQEQGVVRSDFDAFELAAVTTNLMLLRVMTRPEEDPADAARLVSEIVLTGMSVRP